MDDVLELLVEGVVVEGVPVVVLVPGHPHIYWHTHHNNKVHGQGNQYHVLLDSNIDLFDLHMRQDFVEQHLGILVLRWLNDFPMWQWVSERIEDQKGRFGTD